MSELSKDMQEAKAKQWSKLIKKHRSENKISYNESFIRCASVRDEATAKKYYYSNTLMKLFFLSARAGKYEDIEAYFNEKNERCILFKTHYSLHFVKILELFPACRLESASRYNSRKSKNKKKNNNNYNLTPVKRKKPTNSNTTSNHDLEKLDAQFPLVQNQSPKITIESKMKDSALSFKGSCLELFGSDNIDLMVQVFKAIIENNHAAN